jgi:uncharacterized membrane protein YgcG
VTPPSQVPSDASAPTGADSSQSFQSFYDSLSSQGTWIQTDNYGYVWQPQVNDPDWAPYTDGHWVYTDQGWTWASNESFGWATYHYGRWVNIDGTGWVWVPGYTWAPAWVSWRYGEDNVGWAPLPPDSFAGIDYYGDNSDGDYGYHIGGDCDEYYGIGPAFYIFLPCNCLCYHDYHHWYHHRWENYGLIGHTTNVTNINVSRGRAGGGAFGHTRQVTVGGPQLSQINAVSATPVQRVRIVPASQPGGGALSAGYLALYAPHIGTTSPNARPANVSGSLSQISVNRGTDVLHPPMVNAHLAPATLTPEQVDSARASLSQAPASAKVPSDGYRIKPIIQGPVTALRPAPVAAAESMAAGNRGPVSSPASSYSNSGNRSLFAPVHSPTANSQGETPSEREVREEQQQQSGGSRIYSPTPGTVYPNTPRSVPQPTSESHVYTQPAAPTYSAPPSRSYTPPTYAAPPTRSYAPSPSYSAPPSRSYAPSPSYSAPAPSRSSGGGNSGGGSSSGGGGGGRGGGGGGQGGGNGHGH